MTPDRGAPDFPNRFFRAISRWPKQRVVGEHHLKLRVLATGGTRPVEAIAFNQQHPGLRGGVRLAYRLDVNEYRGVESPQLIVEQITAL